MASITNRHRVPGTSAVQLQYCGKHRLRGQHTHRVAGRSGGSCKGRQHTQLHQHTAQGVYSVCITSHHITSHHITSHHITSRHVTSHHITFHYITLRYVMLCYIDWKLQEVKYDRKTTQRTPIIKYNLDRVCEEDCDKMDN